jgi:cytochrome oxidase Cu insertion factor (SCO1/SenC/PrrC family)
VSVTIEYNCAEMPSTATRTIYWLVARWWFWALAVAILFGQPLVRTFLRQAPHVPPVGAAVPAFELVRETGEKVDPSTVSGRVWVASWVKPGAPEADATLEALLRLQKRLRNLGDAVRLVTIASEPATPEILAASARAHHHNPRMWLFASGSAEELARLREAFGLSAPRSEPFLWLIDQQGRMRGAYHREKLDRLVEDLSVLVNGT